MCVLCFWRILLVVQWSSAQTYGTHVLISPHRSPNEPLQKLIWQAHCIQFPICHPRYWEPHCVPSECRAGMDRPDGKHSTLETNYWPRIQSDAGRRRTVDSIVELPGQGEMFAGINAQFSPFVNEVEGNPYLKLYNIFSTLLYGPSASSASMQFLSFLHALNPWILGEENVEGTKGQYRLLSTSWGRRHITLMASVNISLTPILLLLEHLPSPVSPRSQPQPAHNPTRSLLPPPHPSGFAPWGPVCFPARGTGGGTLMRCSGHREMHHNLPAQGPGEIAVFTF